MKAIYTVLIGNYEQLLQAPKFEGWDAVCFTDNINRISNGWILRELPINRELGSVRTSRLPRITPYKYLPEYDESIYIDASVTLKNSPDTWGIDDALWASSRHWERDNVWQEFTANLIAKKSHSETTAKQERDYKARGLESKHIPLYQNCVIYRKHNHAEVIKTCDAWWREFMVGTCRDQLSLPMALGETGLNVTELTPRPRTSTNNDKWKITHNGKHSEYYRGMPLSFLIYNMRGSAISRGVQIGKCLFDRGTRNQVYNPSAIPQIKNSVVVVVKELREKDLVQLKRQHNKIIYDIVDNQPIWERGLGACARYIDAIIFPSNEMAYEWVNKGYQFPGANAVIHHHGDLRFKPNESKKFNPVCISTGAQIPDQVFDLGIDCITEQYAWEGLFDDALKYNLHIAVYKDQNTKHKPPSKLVTAAACNANIILQRLPANMDLLPEEYPYYINDAEEIEGMLELCRRDYGGVRWNKALEMIADVKRKTTGNSIAADYEELIKKLEKPEQTERRQPEVKIPESEKEIKIFFHVGLLGQWQAVFDEQISEIKRSGILDVADLLVCGVGGDKEYSVLLRKYQDALHINSDIRTYEFPTIQIMYDAAKKTETGKSLYIHTKGASRNGKRAMRGAIWRRYMMEACVSRWRECIEYLDKGYDLVGADWKANCIPTAGGCASGRLNGFFAGNFYWANNEYLQTLTRPEISDNRRLAESWIGTSVIKPSVFEMAHIGIADDPSVLDRKINK